MGKIHWRGHGNPLHCSCLENPMVGGAWWATVHEGAKSQTLLKRLSAHIPPHALYKSGASSAQREGRQTWLQRHRCSPSPAHVVSLWSFALPSPSHPQPLALLISGMALGRGLTLGIKSLSDHTHSTTWPVLASLQTQPHGMSEPVTSSIHQNTSSTR